MNFPQNPNNANEEKCVYNFPEHRSSRLKYLRADFSLHSSVIHILPVSLKVK